MEDEIKRTVEAIRDDKSLLARDEATIKTGVVLRLLDRLGWNPFDVNEVVPEYGIVGSRVDFALRLANSAKVFIEVKRPREDLSDHQKQLLDYCFSEGVRLAALTIGTTWWLYLPLREGSWEQRRFYTLDLLEQDPIDVSRRFIEFLSKARIESGEAVRSAEEVITSAQAKTVLLEAIPRAWRTLLTAPDDSLVELLIETTEKQCGLKPEIADIGEFLRRLDRPSVPPVPQRGPRVQQLPHPRQAEMTRNGQDCIGKQIEHFALFGVRRSASTWRELLVGVATELYGRHKNDFDRCLELRGTTMVYFSKDSNELKEPKQISDSAFYAETKLNANSIVRRSWDLLEIFGHLKKDLQITVV